MARGAAGAGDGLPRALGWEDPGVLTALGVDAHDAALSLDPSGDEGLSLAIAGAGSVEIAAPTAGARALVELKRAALRALPVQSVRSLFGLGHSGRRVWFYHYLRPGLDDAAQRFWDAHEAVVREGILGAGAAEREMALFRSRVLPLTVGRSAVSALLGAATDEARAAVLSARWGWRWRAAGRIWAPRLARAAAAPSTGEPAILRHSAWQRLQAALASSAPNPALEWLLTGTWSDLDAGPPWVSSAGHALLRARTESIHVTLADPAALLAGATPGRWSAVSLGRWEPDNVSWASLSRAVRPGGRVLVWSAGTPAPGANFVGSTLAIPVERGLFPGRPHLFQRV